MPDDFEGGRSVLPFMLGAGVMGGYGYQTGMFGRFSETVGRSTATDPISSVVAGRTGSFYSGMADFAPEIAEIDPKISELILEGFRRRVGKATGLGGVTSLQEAVSATSGFPALQSILKQSIQEFGGVTPGQIGAPIATGGMIQDMPVTLTGPRAITNAGAVSDALARNELGLSGAQRTALRQHLEELASVSKEMMEKTPTFQMRTVGNDIATSEMLINIHRAGGPVEMSIPLPSAEGAIQTPQGTRFYARKVFTGMAEGAPQEAYAGEYAIGRLSQLIREQQGGISQRQVSDLQREIRKQLIHTGDPRGNVLASRATGRTYGRQMVVPRAKGQGAAYMAAMEELSGMGRAVGMTPDALAKGIMWTEEGAARLPSMLTPQHYGQAATKGQFLRGAGAADLFQVSPTALERAGKQLGLEVITPQQDTIMMSNLMRGEMQAPMVRNVSIDPNMPAARRFERIQQLLRDNETTRKMLGGGNSVEEAMASYQREMAALGERGRPAYQEMAGLRMVQEGEFLGMTKSGPEFAKTYGADTMIRDIKTVDGMTEVTMQGQYTAQKVFSMGGVKHQLEFADPEAIQRLGVRAKALELMEMRGIRVDPSTPAGAAALRKAEVEAGKMYAGAQGIIVEGAGMKPWEKIYGAKKNVARFNELIESKWRGMGNEMPAGYYETENLMKRRTILGKELQRRGMSWRETFNPVMMARRGEFLQPGPAAEMLGIGGGQPGSFTDDAFRVFKNFGWTSIAEDTASRVIADVPLQDLLQRAMVATRGEGATAVALEELIGRPGGIGAILEDASTRAAFIEGEGGIIQLPQTYKVAGKEISQISVPHMGTGFTGYFTTVEGREIHRDLDRSLRGVLGAAAADIGAEGIAPGELAAAGALEEYYANLANISIKNRNVYGGAVAGSRQMAIGRQILPDAAMAATGEAIPSAMIHPETFENWVAENLQAGMIDRSMAREQRRLFYQGRLPMKAIKHPARGPLSTNLFFAGAAPRAKAGWEAERNVMYLSQSLLKPFMADLDWDPLHVDMTMTRSAMAEATSALESGEVSALLNRHQQIREQVLGRGVKGRGTGAGISAYQGDRISTKFLKETSARAAAGKTKVGAFTTRITWPMAAAAEEAGMGMGDWFKSSFWAEIMEEATTMKARHDTTMAAGAADELAYAFQMGRTDILKSRTREILNLKEGETAYFDDVLDKLTATWKNMSAETRATHEARFAGKGRASAKTFFRLAASDATTAQMSRKGTSGVAANVSKVFGGLGNTMRGHKKELLLGLAASTAAAMLFARPNDLTPEAVESGKVAGGPESTPARLPMPRLEKGLYYKEGSRPGYRINLNLSKEIDHKALARQLSQMVGQKPVNIQMNDARRRITRHDIETEMRRDRGFGSGGGGFYNSSRY